MSDELTPWFPPHIKPVHVGVYRTTREENGPICVSGAGYQHWDGKRWGYFGITPQIAELYKSEKSFYQANYWRGLAEQPK